MSIVFAQIGWNTHKLEGGYKVYRRDVLAQLDALPSRYTYKVVCGPTGSGKSRLLDALSQTGHQVLDLEGLARHRGSVLGNLPQQPQPSQKWFDSILLQTLLGFDPARPVYVEAESKKIGSISLPAALFDAMHGSPCLLLDVPLEIRVNGLLEDYHYYVENPEKFIEDLKPLYKFHGAKQLEDWSEQIRTGNFAGIVTELLIRHYDPSYKRATTGHYAQLDKAQRVSVNDLSENALNEIARMI